MYMSLKGILYTDEITRLKISLKQDLKLVI